MNHTAGSWDRNDDNVYFIASNPDSLLQGQKSHDWLLVAINELKDGHPELVEGWADAGKHILVDSGVFMLCAAHAKRHDIGLNEAFALAPEDIDGFDALFAKWIDIVDRLGDKTWGYIEIDQGGRENKRRTRAKLEALGYRPIPVFHPLTDGWDYFDELAESYDRVCIGSLVQADRATRMRYLASVWERRRRHPDLWIHMLGLTPNEWACAWPINSCDSSAWLRHVRWAGSAKSHVSLKPFGSIPRGFRYRYDATPMGHHKSRQMGGYKAHFTMHTWRSVRDAYAALGCDPGAYL